MFGRASTASVDGVQIHLTVVGDVAAHHRTLDEVHIVEFMGDTGRVMQILHGAVAVRAPVRFDHIHRSACSAVVDARALKQQVMGWLAAKECDGGGGFGEHVFHQRAGEADAPVVAEDCACACKNFDARGRRIAEADGFERFKSGLVNFEHIGICQGLVAPAFHACADRAGGGIEGRCAGRATGIAASRTCGCFDGCLVGHDSGPFGRCSVFDDEIKRGTDRHGPRDHAPHQWCG